MIVLGCCPGGVDSVEMWRVMRLLVTGQCPLPLLTVCPQTVRVCLVTVSMLVVSLLLSEISHVKVPGQLIIVR